MDKELSDFKLERKECPKCGAVWLNGQLRWATGQVGNSLDLAGLVCNQVDKEAGCINELKGSAGGDTWEKRAQTIQRLLAEAELDGQF